MNFRWAGSLILLMGLGYSAAAMAMDEGGLIMSNHSSPSPVAEPQQLCCAVYYQNSTASGSVITKLSATSVHYSGNDACAGENRSTGWVGLNTPHTIYATAGVKNASGDVLAPGSTLEITQQGGYGSRGSAEFTLPAIYATNPNEVCTVHVMGEGSLGTIVTGQQKLCIIGSSSNLNLAQQCYTH